MSKLDKEKVLSEFSDAYKTANGKTPKIEESSGWFSVDGGKNMRLAKVAEWTAELSGGKPAAKKATAKPAPKVVPKAKAKPAIKVSKSTGGLSAKEAWQQRLEKEHDECQLPRGF
ncbi:MAG TPA: hypothetical protein VKY35_07680 [Aliidiomarina sp.]|nr:hypothetical protein [Aliidiomarina sp.]